MLTIEQINERLSALVQAMLAKGRIRPNAEIWLRADAEPAVLLEWRDANDRSQRNWLYGAAAEDAFAAAEQWIAALPSPEQERLNAFMESLGATIELGKKADITIETMNPLMEAMKRISNNAIAEFAR